MVLGIEIDLSGESKVFPRGQVWKTQNGYFLTFQDDSNLVLYAPDGRPLRATGCREAELLAMQEDGNVVLYAGGEPLWATNTSGRGRRLVLQPDGNLVIYDRSGDAVWASGTDGARERGCNAAEGWAPA